MTLSNMFVFITDDRVKSYSSEVSVVLRNIPPEISYAPSFPIILFDKL